MDMKREILRLFFTALIVSGFPLLVSGQLSNIRTVKRPVTDTIQIDSLPVIPNSVVTKPNIQFELLAGESQLVPQNTTSDSIEITYRTFPTEMFKTYQNKNPNTFRPDYTGKQNPFSYVKAPDPGEGLTLSRLNKSGSISRGLNFGNNQNLGVNSNLNLQLSGKITDEVGVRAAISDENIPVQPEGNTQQLQDFDQVYIQVYGDNSQLTAGDYMIEDPNSYFLDYQKRLRGGAFETEFSFGSDRDKDYKNEVGASAALSRGKFARNIIQGVEGNQGPYRLSGSDNEQFIIILSGTEKVYIDGKLLKRGEDYDYVIDYNKAEITFTALQPITKDERIIVEFQYSSQAYARSLLEFHDNLDLGKLKLNFNAYSEQDSKNQPFQQDINDNQRNILENVGDDIENAFAPSANAVGYQQGEVLYKRIPDSVENNGVDSIYVYSTNPDSAIYRVQFSDVGPGNGNYIQVQSGANGRVYEYIAPMNGQPQGRYEPVILLVTPKQRQMFTFGGTYDVSERTSSFFEVALSKTDLNTFSDEDSGDDYGQAVRAGISTNQPLGQSQKPLTLSVGGEVEYVNDTFEPIQRFRSVEFDRDWNIRDLDLTETQFLPTLNLGLFKDSLGSMDYAFKSFMGGSEYEALRHSGKVNVERNGFDVDFDASQTTTSGELSKSEYYRHKTLATKEISFLEIGYRDDLENNLRYTPQTDSLNNTAYSWWEWEAFVQKADSAENFYKLGYTNRTDRGVKNGNLQTSTLGNMYAFQFALNKNPNSTLKGKATYRTLEIQDTSIYDGDPERNLISRLEYSFRALEGAISSTSFYEIGGGLEEEKEYVYVEVAPGQGTYTWTDYNGNDVQEKDEFEIAQFQDQANFMRISVTTNDFVRTYSNQFNQQLNLMPVRAWRNEDGLKEFLAKFSNQSSYRISRKTLRDEGLDRFNPFYRAASDSALISMTNSFRNTLFFNRSNENYGVEWTYQDLVNKNLLSNGFESRSDRYHLADLRLNFIDSWQINLIGRLGTKSTSSEFFQNRNYNIQYYRAEPVVTYQPSAKIQVKLSVEYDEQNNTLLEIDGETATTQSVNSELRWNQVGKGSVIIKASYIEIDFEGPVNSPVAYEMLQGLNSGVNGTWEVTFQRSIGKNLQVNLTYAGRKSTDVKTIHTGNMQVRAYF
jgi:hypothetical protein